MASQAKFSDMMSQFSSGNGPYKPPPPKKQRQKIKAQYSQLDVQSVDVSNSTNKCLTGNAENAVKPVQNNEFEWSDEEIDGVELDAILSQYDVPRESAAQAEANCNPAPQMEDCEMIKPDSKINLPRQDIIIEKTMTKQVDPKPSSSNLKKDELEKQASSQVVAALKRAPNAEKRRAKRSAESNSSNTPTVDCVDPIFDVILTLKTEKKKCDQDIKSKEELEKTEALLSATYAELMNVPTYSPRLYTSKNIHQHWELRSLDSAEKWFPEEQAPSLRLQLVLLESTCNADLLNLSRNLNEPIDLSYQKDSPNMHGLPLVLQQIAQICDTAAIRHDYFTLGPVVCASVNFITSVLLFPDNNYLHISHWILQKCADMKTVPCVLLSLLEAMHRILASKPKLLKGICLHGYHDGPECHLAKICRKLAAIIHPEETVKGQQTDQFAKELKEHGPQKEVYKIQVALKLCDVMTSLHFASSVNLPGCISPAHSAECMRSIFRLTSKIVIYFSTLRNTDYDCEDLFRKFALVMSWMSANRAHFKLLVCDMHAELYCFLAKQAKVPHDSLVGVVIKKLISTYSTWRTELWDTQEVAKLRRLSSVAEISTPKSSEKMSLL
ncbi:uncharacterized protein LOC135934643 [Cloeon dipterum]|uniref:uncharacterized protein LOC135934643 n=1 Tax=Cloeon dipterum TaxID=197152 RepID=UPI0032207D54